MINSSPPVLVNNHMTRAPSGPHKQNLSLNSTTYSDLAGLQPRSFKSPVMSPTSKFHSEGLPQSVGAINASDSEEIFKFVAASSESLILDVRPFNLYSQSHIQSSVNICVPTTLLKRPKYDLQHMISASNLPPDLKKAVLDTTRHMRVLLYDSGSVDTLLSFQLHQTMLKFLPHDRFDLFYVRGGYNKIDSLLTECSTSPTLPLHSPPLGAPHAKPSPSDKGSSTKNNQNAEESGTPFLTGFSLPSATSSDNKLLMSIKKSNLKLDTATTYSYNFHFPENFKEKKSRLPKWLSFFADVFEKEDSMRLIVNRFNDMFNRLEKTEQIRLRMAISNIDKDSEVCRVMDRNLHESAGYGTPLTLCPCCDKIEYTIPQGVEYGHKNRYNNIWPYEHSRVHLISSPSCTHRKDSTDDYFNANYISFKKISERGYIATQNPLDATKDDFWSTVWYKNVKAIVCLAASPVFGQQAYYEYDQFLEKNDLAIKIESVEKFDSFTMREITLSKNNESHTVYHFAFQNWPDFGTPDDLGSVFDLLRTQNEKLALWQDNEVSAANPIDSLDVLVHCSAGCGRTGCYITMDMVVDSFENPNCNEAYYDPWGEDDLVYKSIQFQRQQRLSMVQNLDQFIFCYESILNYIVTHLIK